MASNPEHEIVVLLVLVAVYAGLGAAIWLIFCGSSANAVRELNSAIASRGGPVFLLGDEPDLRATLDALVAERRLSKKLANRLNRIDPVFHAGKWVAYPSNAYWRHRFGRLRSR